VSILRLSGILIIGETIRGEEERRRGKEGRKGVVSSALSGDAALRISALFCPAPRSGERFTEE